MLDVATTTVETTVRPRIATGAMLTFAVVGRSDEPLYLAELSSIKVRARGRKRRRAIGTKLTQDAGRRGLVPPAPVRLVCGIGRRGRSRLAKRNLLSQSRGSVRRHDRVGVRHGGWDPDAAAAPRKRRGRDQELLPRRARSVRGHCHESDVHAHGRDTIVRIRSQSEDLRTQAPLSLVPRTERIKGTGRKSNCTKDNTWSHGFNSRWP